MTPDRYWQELVQNDGRRAALNLVLGRIGFFKANTKEPNGEGWAHLNETARLVEAILDAVIADG